MPTFSKNARYISSVTNIVNCGGNKKAGLGTTIGKRSFMIRRTRQNNTYPKLKVLSNIWELFGNNPELLEGENNDDLAGNSVALSSDGKTVAIGEVGFDGGENNGRVRVFRLVNNTWTLLDTANALVGATAGNLAGVSVALSSDGNTVAIGEPGFDNDSDTSAGRVRVFRLDGNDEWQLVDPATALVGENANDLAGDSVALSSDGNTVAIGEPGFGNDKGRVRVFRLVNDRWTLLDTANALEGKNDFDFTGDDSVALSSDGNTVAIGEPGFNNGNNKGRVRVFTLDGNRWKQVGENPTALEGVNNGDNAGVSVALSSDGNTVAFGEPNFDGDTGRVRVFRLDGNTWTQVGTNPDALEGENDDFAGDSVALSSDGNTVAIGEFGFDGDKGRVRVFRLVNNRWILIDTDTALEGETVNNFAGSSVALSSNGNTVAIGERGFVGGSDAGRVRVFTLPEVEVEEGKCPSAFSNYRPVLAGVGNMYRFKMY